jgi:hypothetical protein
MSDAPDVESDVDVDVVPVSKLRMFWTWLRNRSRRELVVLVLAVVACVAVGFGLWLLVRFGIVQAVVSWLQGLGREKAAIVLFALFLVCSTPFSSFAGVLSVICGFLMKSVPLAMVVVGSGVLFGGIIVFMLVRVFLRQRTRIYLASSPVFSSLLCKADFRVAILMRVGGIPVGVVNAILGVTEEISLVTFCWTCVVGELRRNFVGCWLGSTIQNVQAAAAGEFEWTTANLVVMGAGAVVAVAAFVAGLVVGNKLLDEALQDQQQQVVQQVEMEEVSEDFSDDQSLDMRANGEGVN